ncbi:MAG: FtsQ-type POTRA domain-containing protein [Candidatus Eisenbacteria bacterium]|nr:FtsQ-type POTRA domain-containing protein [Candidatus Eisenbacteria bacterium]
MRRKTRKKLYCGKGYRRKRVSFDLVLRMVFVGLVVALAVAKLPEARARVLGSSLFKLNSVSLRGNRYLLDSQVLRIAGVEKGTCGLRYDTDKIEARLEKHPRIKSADVKKLLWKKLYIRVEERTPFALVDSHRLLEMDETGAVFEPVDPAVLPDVPIITGLSGKRVKAGDTLKGSQVSQAIAILQRLRDPEVNLYGQISEVNLRRDGSVILVAVESGVPVNLGSGDVSKRKLQALRVAMADMQQKGLLPGSVDLRFKDQVVATVQGQTASSESDEKRSDAAAYALF